MPAALTVFLALLGLPDAAPAIPPVDPGAFREWFDEARAGRLEVPAAVERRARGFRYVFVGGFASERVPSYFHRNAKALRARGVPRSAIHCLFPDSHRTLAENAGTVRAAFLAIAEEGPEPLVIVAHSRGASAALAFALEEPEFVRARVAALFLVQGPFGGTALADYVEGDAPPSVRALPWRFRAVVRLLGAFERLLVRAGRHGGLDELTRAGARRYWSQSLREHAEAADAIGPKVYFVRTEAPPGRLGPFRRAAGWYLSTCEGPNDGVVAVEDQSVPGLGTRLDVLDGGHVELTRRTRPARASRRSQSALADCIILAVGRSDP